WMSPTPLPCSRLGWPRRKRPSRTTPPPSASRPARRT
ncbi:MAG: Pyridoxamine 5'-phosphate oxidase, partial [uncultured Acetobacteraceae bacterium]